MLRVYEKAWELFKFYANNRQKSAEAHQPGHGTAVNEYRLTGFIQ